MTIVGKWTSPRICVGAYDLSGYLKSVGLKYDADMLDASVFGNTTKVNTAGPTSIALNGSGLMPATSASDLTEKQLFDNVSLVNVPVSILPTNSPAEADPAYFFLAAISQIQFGGPWGQLYPFTLTGAQGNNGYPLIRGYVLEPGSVARTTSGNGTGSNAIGAISSTQYLYAALHVYGLSSPTSLVVTIVSAPAANFSSPTTRATFTTVTTGISSQYLARVAGPVTDTYWRAAWTVAGTSYTFACVAGVA